MNCKEWIDRPTKLLTEHLQQLLPADSSLESDSNMRWLHKTILGYCIREDTMILDWLLETDRPTN